jgi:hypothetical protein
MGGDMNRNMLIFLLLVSNCSVSHAQLQFSKKEIAVVKWGNKNDQIGSSPNSIGLFSLDGMGNFYIADCENKKVLVLSRDGTFIRSVSLDDPTKIIQGRNALADSAGNILVPFNDSKTGFNEFSYLVIKPNGEREFYVEKQKTAQNWKNLCEKIKKEEGMGESYFDAWYSRPPADMDEISDDKIGINRDELVKRLAKKNKTIEDADDVDVEINFSSLAEIRKDEVDFQKFGKKVTANLIGVDNEGEIFLLCGFSYDPEKVYQPSIVSELVAVYSLEGRLLSTIPMAVGTFEEQDGMGPLDVYDFAVNRKGDLFHIFRSKDGVHVLGFSKQ